MKLNFTMISIILPAYKVIHHMLDQIFVGNRDLVRINKGKIENQEKLKI